MDTLFVLGRQPEIGLAELESLSSASSVRLLSDTCAACSQPVDFSRLGSSQKSGPVIASFKTTDLKKVFASLSSHIKSIVANMPPEGKIKLGASVYGIDTTPYQIQGELLRLKKTLRSSGRSARVVPNETTVLSSATTYHNRLHRDLGLELAIVCSGDTTTVARITAVQDIDAYRIRDRERPKRDAFVGMLPPKLAQTMINLASGAQASTRIVDPFCGTGVVLQEALLMGHPVYGSDINPKMIDYSRINLEWICKAQNLSDADYSLDVADATSVQIPPAQAGTATSIASETYLGQPLGGQSPSEEKILDIMHGVNTLARNFLKNIAPQLEPGSRHCIAFPAWYVDEREYHLPVLDELVELGFERITFAHPPRLVYRRDDQQTARELVVVRKVDPTTTP